MNIICLLFEQVIDVSDVMLVYNTSHFKSLATGGNVSQALACAGEKACYQTIVSHNGQLFILGTKTAHLYTLRTWREVSLAKVDYESNFEC